MIIGGSKILSSIVLFNLLILPSFALDNSQNLDDVQIFRSPNATNRQFSMGLFNFLRFDNSVCETSKMLSGTCLTYKQCRQHGGIADGTCASGFGVCCIVTKTCNQEIMVNGTHFNHPAQGATGGGACRVTVHKVNKNICQVRLDLLHFQTVGPNQMTGRCDRDYFRVSGQDTNSIVPTVCGENTGQHLIFDVASSAEKFYLQMTTSSNSTMSRTWRIRVLQIECDNPSKAPPGCLQYHEGISGNLKSFNYDNTRPREIGYPGSTHYAICIRKELSHCGGTFISQGVFGVGGLPNNPPDQPTNCNSDFIVVGDQRYCGGTRLGPDQTTNPTIRGPGPIVLTFVTSARLLTSETDSYPGFNIHYSQNDCFA